LGVGEGRDEEQAGGQMDELPEQGTLFADPSDPLAPGDRDLVGYRGPTACSAAGITYRQLDYWARTDLVRPSVADAKGSGSRRQYSYRDLLELKVIKTLLDAGIKLESVRSAFEYLRDQLGEDVASAQLVIDGNSAILVTDNKELIDVISQGQGVLSILPLEGVQREVDAAIVELRPESTTDATANAREDGGAGVSAKVGG
jgi:DNA-binding transcriptional MerR regulator